MTHPSGRPQVYLIRHGQTEWSRSGRHTGRTDIPLDAAGEAQAHGLAHLLRNVRFDRVMTSPRQRTRQTCDYCRLRAEVETEPDLVEWDYGEYEGKLSTEIRQDNPGWNIFEHGCPGGETPRQVSDRADRVIARLPVQFVIDNDRFV